MYSPIYNENHQIFTVSENQKRKILQKGAREPLLCVSCETQFSLYEKYFAEVIFNLEFGPLLPGVKLRIVRNLDYASLKLFFLSILWRFGVTSIETLTGASLGPHLERLRLMLLSRDPGGRFEYGCTLTEVTLKDVPLEGWIVPPRRGKPRDQWVWNITLGRFLLSYNVTNKIPPEQIQPLFVAPSGELVIYRADLRDIPFLLPYAKFLAALPDL